MSSHWELWRVTCRAFYTLGTPDLLDERHAALWVWRLCRMRHRRLFRSLRKSTLMCETALAEKAIASIPSTTQLRLIRVSATSHGLRANVGLAGRKTLFLYEPCTLFRHTVLTHSGYAKQGRFYVERTCLERNLRGFSNYRLRVVSPKKHIFRPKYWNRRIWAD